MDLFRRRRIEAHIDMTPMIDTLLQLFLIFMVGATMASSSIDINLPRAKKTEAGPGVPTRVVTVSSEMHAMANIDIRDLKVTFATDAGPDKRNYRADFSKITRALPEFRPQWDARKGQPVYPLRDEDIYKT